MIRRILSAIFYAEKTHVAPAMQLPPGIDPTTFWRLHAMGYTRDDAIWLCDFWRLCETSLREYDGVAL